MSIALTGLFLMIFGALNEISSQDSIHQNEGNVDIATQEVNKNHLKLGMSIGGASYLAASYTLYQSWYADYPQSGFHFYNDWGEWQNVDKAGHLFSGYFQSNWAYKGWKWMGMNEKKAIFAGAATGFIAQTTIEVMDGFSSEWGFSIPDFTANILGITAFTAQQVLWNEQRITFKTSSSPINYLDKYGDEYYNQRANALYGENFFSRYLKDYNAQTTWVSVNLQSFFPHSNVPDWLNVALGYGAENLFGGYTNQGINEAYFENYPRYSQFFISLDADLSRIETDSPFLRTLLDLLNIIKIPFSTIEINTLGEIKFYAVKF